MRRRELRIKWQRMVISMWFYWNHISFTRTKLPLHCVIERQWNEGEKINFWWKKMWIEFKSNRLQIEISIEPASNFYFWISTIQWRKFQWWKRKDWKRNNCARRMNRKAKISRSSILNCSRSCFLLLSRLFCCFQFENDEQRTKKKKCFDQNTLTSFVTSQIIDSVPIAHVIAVDNTSWVRLNLWCRWCVCVCWWWCVISKNGKLSMPFVSTHRKNNTTRHLSGTI